MRFQGFRLAVICAFAWGASFPVIAQQADGGTTATPAARAEIIKFIRVEGTQRVEEESVRAYMVVSEGMVDDIDMVDRSVKTLFGSGLFSDVTIRRSCLLYTSPSPRD